METSKALMNLLTQIQDREQEISDIRQEIKDAIEQFCEEFEEFEPRGVKEGIKFFKKLTKDQSSTVDLETQRERIIDLLMNGNQVLITDGNQE